MSFEEFKQSREFTPEEVERRRVNEYWRPGSTEQNDKQEYLNSLENEIAAMNKILSGGVKAKDGS